jgi:hypothetical protein
MNLSPEYIEKLKKLAKLKTCEENSEEEYFNPSDWFGGNYDDAYAGGVTTGTIDMARQVLTELGIDF